MCAFRAPTLALLAATVGADQGANGAHQMLAADGKSCAEANWPRNFEPSAERGKAGEVVPPLDSEWGRRWLPSVSQVRTDECNADLENSVGPARASSLWDAALLENATLWQGTVVFLEGTLKHGARCTPGALCHQLPDEVHRRGMLTHVLLRNNDGHWACEGNAMDLCSPSKTCLSVFDPEIPCPSRSATPTGHATRRCPPVPPSTRRTCCDCSAAATTPQKKSPTAITHASPEAATGCSGHSAFSLLCC